MEPFTPLFDHYLDMVIKELQSPFSFSIYHEQITHPFNYYQFGLNFFSPLIIKEKSQLMHPEQVENIEKQLEQGDNVILFANHQAEPDPQAISFLLEEKHPELAQKMIFVAGHRVTQDPMAIPFSLGRNLLCIYSKKHIENPPEKKGEKQLHNQRTMKRMSELLAEGGHCIYVAPSGGRDRPNARGVLEIAPFDPQSIEMIRLMAKKADHPTHFYPLALKTYHWFPPPKKVGGKLGEARIAHRSGVAVAFGVEIDMHHFPGSEMPDKKKRREHLAQFIWNQVKSLYDQTTDDL